MDSLNLNQMQWYLSEETIEDYDDGLITRRTMLRRLIAICGGSAAAAALMSACGAPLAAPTTAPQPKAPAAPTGGGGATLSVPADSPDVKAEDIVYPSQASITAYLARPAAAGTYPGVIVIHENRGLTDHIKDVARRLAKAGFIALAPDLVSRSGKTTAQTDAAQVSGLLGGTTPADLIADLNAGITFLAAQPGIKSPKVGVVGFCFGGGYTLRLAASNPNIGAAICYYGVTPDPASVMTATNAAVLGQYGADDARINGTIPALEAALAGAGKTFEKHVYEGAGHAFNNDTGQRYNEKAAVEAWTRTLAWFNKYL